MTSAKACQKWKERTPSNGRAPFDQCKHKPIESLSNDEDDDDDDDSDDDDNDDEDVHDGDAPRSQLKTDSLMCI